MLDQISVTAAGEQRTASVDRLRRLLRKELLQTSPAPEVARAFANQGRIAKHRLEVNSVELRALVDRVRFELAREFVADRDVPLAKLFDAQSHTRARLLGSRPERTT